MFSYAFVTRRQTTRAKRSREMDILSDYDNMHVMLRSDNSNSIEKELANTIIGSACQNDTEAVFHRSGISSQVNGTKG